MSHRRHADKQNSDSALACGEIRERMLALLDADEALDGATRRSLQQHLDSCSACRREWDWHQRAEQGLRQAKRNVPEPGDLRAGFYARLAASEPPRRLSLLEALRRTPAPALGALSALAILAAGGYLHLPWQGQSQSPVHMGNAVPDIVLSQPLEQSRPWPLPAPVAAMPMPAVALPPGLVLSGQRLRVAQSSVPTPLNVPQPTRLPMTVTPPRDPLLRMPHMTGHPGLQVAMVDTNTAFNYQTRRDDVLTQPDDRQPAVRSQPLASAKRSLATADRPAAALSESVSGAASGPSFAVGASAGSANGVMLHAGRYIAPRAELMSEEVSIHLVNERNEEVNVVHVAATPDATDPAHTDQPSIVHIEADADTTTSGAAPTAERADP